MKQNIAIIGAGKIGTALKTILLKKDIEIDIWDRDKVKLQQKKSLAQIISKAEIIFLCIPSWANREILKKIRHNLTPNSKKIVITLSKGFEKEGCKTMSQVLQEELKEKAHYGVLVGPMLAVEIEKGYLTKGIIALSTQKYNSSLKELFNKTNLDISFSQDLSGVSALSALKNIYALAFGMADELKIRSYRGVRPHDGVGSNIKGYLLTQVLQEMKKIILIFGGKQKTVHGLAGVGDLFTTINSNLSHNYNFGKQIIVKSGIIHYKKTEGTVSLEAISKLLGDKIRNFKILYLLEKIIIQKSSPQEEFNKLLQ